MAETVCLVGFSVVGHEFDYLRLLLEAWSRRSRRPRLVVVVRPGLIERHPSLDGLVREAGATLRIVAPAAEEQLRAVEPRFRVSLASILPGATPDPSTRVYWEVATAEAQAVGASHLFFLEIDRCLPAIAAGLRAGCAVSGIWFKPAFHYGAFAGEAGAPRDSASTERWVIARALAHPELERIFCLDPYAAERLSASAAPGRAPVVALADPAIQLHQPKIDRDVARRELGFTGTRFTLLFFGLLGARKGVIELLEAVERLPGKDAARLHLVLAGPPSDIPVDRIAAHLSRLQVAGVATTFEPGQVPDERVAHLLAASDAVSVLYQQHIGMSGVLLHAASAGRPVLAQSLGLIGHEVRTHRLGVTVDTARPAAITAALHQVLTEGAVPGFDAACARAFAEAHDPRFFSDAIVGALAG